MPFFTDKKYFTHVGRFYGVPIYLNLDEPVPVISGTNKITHLLFTITSFIHNNVIEFFAQLFSAMLGREYEAGLSVWITGEIIKK